MSIETQRDDGERQIDEAQYQSLTPTERACLRLAASGRQAKEIGPNLDLTYRSVQQYLYSASRKLGMRGGARAGSALLAYEARRQIELVQSSSTESATLDPSPSVMAYPVPGDLPISQSDRGLGQAVRERPALFEAPSVEIASAGQGRVIDLGISRRLLVILAWFVGAPAGLALVVVGYLGITLIERALTAP